MCGPADCRKAPATLLAVIALAIATGSCAPPAAGPVATLPRDPLVGAWRSKVQFTTSAFASVKDLEFMYVFNDGGTMTESSNYDGSPPVPPAYGVWQKTGPGAYKVVYDFFTTSPPKAFDDLAKGGGWSPAGRGELTEQIRLAADGKSFESTIVLQMFDAKDKPVEGGGEAVGHGALIGG